MACDHQRVLKEATMVCEDIEKKIGKCKEQLTETEKQIGNLNEELVVALKKVAGIEAAGRTVDIGAKERKRLIVRRMVDKISDVFETIDHLAELDFVLPCTINMGLELLELMPHDALSDIAASMYKDLALHVKKSKGVRRNSLFSTKTCSTSCVSHAAAA